jgi:hypothetical protein
VAESKRQIAEREEIRLAIAAFFMGCEIAANRGDIDGQALADNGELADRGLRRADMLMQKHEQSKHGG